MPKKSNSGAIENIKHKYSITSCNLLSALGLSGHWIDSAELESFSFVDSDGEKRRGKRLNLVVSDRIEA